MKILRIIISGLVGFGIGFFAGYKIVIKNSLEWKKMSDKHLAILRLFNQWMIVNRSGDNIANFLERQGYQRIIIYGMSYVGQRLLDELEESDIEIVAAIDQNANTLNSPVPILFPQDDVPDADCIIVTAISHFPEIKEMLSVRVCCPVVSLEEILYEIQ